MMGSVYKRGSLWWVVFKVPGGKRVWRSTGIDSTQPEIEAQRLLKGIEQELASSTHRATHSELTVAEWALQWTEARKAAKQTNAPKDYARLKIHVLPTLGGRRLASVSPLDVRKLVAALRSTMDAPRMVINTYGLVRRLFADAVADELILSTPCALKRRDLPKKTDKDPTWRDGAVFTRDEAELLLTAPSIPLDRRVTYGLGLLGGMREGEISALKVGAYNRHPSPLPRLLVSESYTRANGFVKSTKTGNPRQVPVHPVLARILGEWLETGFAEMFGREPVAGDLLVPNHAGGYRTDNTFVKCLNRDLEALGLRHRRMHDTRRTFISLGREDGANPSVLKTITHDQVGDQFDQYTTFSWSAKCEAVSCLKITGRATFISVAATGTDGGSVESSESVTRGVTFAPPSPATIGHPSTLPSGQGGTRTRLSQRQSTPDNVIPVGCPPSERPQESLRVVPCHNVTDEGLADDLAGTLGDFRARGDRKRLAARLRVLLAFLRSPLGGRRRTERRP